MNQHDNAIGATISASKANVQRQEENCEKIPATPYPVAAPMGIMEKKTASQVE